jgi:GLPGLI family protein
MKKSFAACYCLLLATLVHAQQKEGKVVYQRTVQMQINFAGDDPQMERMIPRSRTEKFELNFGNNQSIWRAAEQDDDDMFPPDGGGGGIRIRMVGQGPNDVVYSNFETGRRVEQRDLFDKKFVIDDSIRPLKWKMTGETKNILNHNCMKATTTQISQRMAMNMDNGVMRRKEVSDTAEVIAWFASDIPVSAGPAEFQGQLPGLILEMDISNGRQVFQAVEISPKVDFGLIKEPKSKKRYTMSEFQAERDKMMAEMERNRPAGRREVRMIGG